MWFRSIQRIGFLNGSTSSAGLISNTFIRYFSRKRAENLRKINPKLTPQEASSVAQDLYGLIKNHGPLSIANAWIKAQESGVSGLNSKTHMKIMLKWMRGRKMLRLFCNQIGSSKKFLLSSLPDDPQTVQMMRSSEVAVKRTKKPSLRRKKKSK